jgi:hypothetical protein
VKYQSKLYTPGRVKQSSIWEIRNRTFLPGESMLIVTVFRMPK